MARDTLATPSETAGAKGDAGTASESGNAGTAGAMPSLGTDFYLMDELLTAEERAIRDRVRAFCDREVIPVINEYWEKAEFPFALIPECVFGCRCRRVEITGSAVRSGV